MKSHLCTNQASEHLATYDVASGFSYFLFKNIFQNIQGGGESPATVTVGLSIHHKLDLQTNSQSRLFVNESTSGIKLYSSQSSGFSQ